MLFDSEVTTSFAMAPHFKIKAVKAAFRASFVRYLSSSRRVSSSSSSGYAFSARNELYKFLGLGVKDVGTAKASKPEHIHSSVIFPEDSTGMPNGVHIVSFVMTAQELLDCAFVFRKENWDQEDSGYYYQRLIDKAKISSIRSFLVREQRTFIDSIIVSLPKEAKFHLVDEDGNPAEEINPRDINDITSQTVIKIPYKSNSIGIIDGQHRVFGHHEAPDSKDERIIAELRNKRHLFVTGFFYQKGVFSESEKRKFESKIFLEINKEQKKVNAQIINHVLSLEDPLSAIGLSMSVIQKMNARPPFLNHFLLSELDSKGIKTPTIIAYGLNTLVKIDDSKDSLFAYWKNPSKELLRAENTDNEAIRKQYVTYCADEICKFFVAVKNNHGDAWSLDGKNKLLTVTSIVAFLKSFGRSLEIYKEVKDIPFYQKKLAGLKIDFKNKKTFPYVSSQWPKFAEEINKIWT